VYDLDHPSQIPEPYDLASFLDMEKRHFSLNLPGRQMASKATLDFSSTVFRTKFRTGMTVRSYPDNEVGFSQGDSADAVVYIQSGTVKLTVASTRRKKAIIAVLLGSGAVTNGTMTGTGSCSTNTPMCQGMSVTFSGTQQ